MNRWIRTRAKALWLAFQAWQVTRKLRATTERVKQGHKVSDQEYNRIIQEYRDITGRVHDRSTR